MGVAHFEVVAEDVVESDLQGRYACTLDLALLHLEEVVLAVAGYLPELVEFLVDTRRDDVALSELGCGFRMHCPAEVVQKFCAVAHLRDQFVKRLNALASAQTHYRSGLAEAATQLHHLTRHNLSSRCTGNYTLKVSNIAYHSLQTHQVISIVDEMLDYRVPVLKFLQIHHRHRQPGPEHSRSHRRRTLVHHLDEGCTLLSCCGSKDLQIAECKPVHPDKRILVDS